MRSLNSSGSLLCGAPRADAPIHSRMLMSFTAGAPNCSKYSLPECESLQSRPQRPQRGVLLAGVQWSARLLKKELLWDTDPGGYHVEQFPPGRTNGPTSWDAVRRYGGRRGP